MTRLSKIAGPLLRKRAGMRPVGLAAMTDWSDASAHLIQPMADHARIGGSRAQRDLLEYTLLQTLLKQDRTEEAKHLLALRRPVQAGTHPVLGM